MAMSESNDRLENLIRLLRTLPEDEIAVVQTFVEGLARRQAAVQEARAPYTVSTGVAEDVVYWTPPQQGSRDALLECVGIWEFGPGELDEILGDIEQSRMMELETEYAQLST